ncbi:TPA: hypothetical protein N2D16_002830 [Clostridium botulinum]|nr:hypothetical protein [Clostridium botulinum]HCL4455206.1 hypothetical protein [Clostridium botulinum]
MDKIEQLSIIDRVNDILGFNDDIAEKQPKKQKKQEQTYKGMKPSQKVKVLKIPVDESILEGNLIEIPFISYYKEKEPLTAVEYVWVDSKGVEKTIEVRGSKWGVPDEYCFDVLTALFRLHMKQNKCIEFDIENQKWNMNKTINFSLSELAREMGYKSLGKNVFDKLDIALEILNDTTIYNKAGGTFLDVKTNTYLTPEKKESIRIVTHYKSYRYSNRDKDQKRINYREIKDYTSVKIDDFIYESLCNSYFKIFNYESYRLLKMGIAKKIYLLLSKWRANRSKVFLNWKTLYQKIPLTDKKPEKYRRKRIRDAYNKLIEIGFLVRVHENTKGVEFIFEDTANDELALDVIESKDKPKKYNTIMEILMALNELKIDNVIIQSILNSVSIEVIKTTLEESEGLALEERQGKIKSLL